MQKIQLIYALKSQKIKRVRVKVTWWGWGAEVIGKVEQKGRLRLS